MSDSGITLDELFNELRTVEDELSRAARATNGTGLPE